MPKLKTNKAVSKRFTVTGTGKLKRMRANKGHNVKDLKSPKRVRRLRKSTLVDKTKEANYKKVLPYL
ncbi:MAG: 50S ribosomal protein L35 [Clostridiales bacterium]|nr:50S ribosomal protein L35 [Clostridiales bacterium]